MNSIAGCVRLVRRVVPACVFAGLLVIGSGRSGAAEPTEVPTAVAAANLDISSQSNVTLTVTRVGVNLVKVTSDYDRLPVVTVPLTRAMGRILQARGDSVFLLDPTKEPTSLDVTFNGEVSWSGTRQ